MKLYKIKKSNIDKRGLYASKNIKAGEKIIEYVGKLISKKETEINPKFDNSKDIYLFNSEPKVQWVIPSQKVVSSQNFAGPNEPYGIVVNYYLKNRSRKYAVPKSLKLQELRSLDRGTSDSLLSLYIEGRDFGELVKEFSERKHS